MYKKAASPNWFNLLKKSAVVLFVAEGAAFVGSYLFWSKLNTDRGADLREQKISLEMKIIYNCG